MGESKRFALPLSPVVLAGGVIALGALAAYSGSFSGPFVFDDGSSILGNPTILHLGRLGEVLNPPSAGGATVGGRPLLNLSLAINYAISGDRVWSYHALNLLIHILAGLTLFGLVRRTLLRRADDAGGALLAALAVALIWTVHPLQTESVTYIVQRAESLMGLFYLLTLYCFVRYSGETLARSAPGTIERHETLVHPRSGTRKRFLNCWAVGSIACCLLGMATKEVMVSAPVIVLLYDRTFAAGSFRDAWRLRRGYYLSLASTWLLLAALVIHTGGNRGGSTGLGSHVSWLTYVLGQFPAILHYLRLSVWPHPLVFYYAVRWMTLWEAAPSAFFVLLIAAGTVCALARNRPIGFLGTWFFAVLAPSSLIAGSGQTIAEHRMYLALAPVVAAIVLPLFRPQVFRLHHRIVLLGLTAAMALAAGTHWRNRAYRSELALWSDTVAKTPDNAVAECGLGVAEFQRGNPAAAERLFEAALRVLPDYADALIDMANLRRAEGRPAEAGVFYRRALQLQPDYPEALVNLANLDSEEGKAAEALDLSRRALRLRPRSAEARQSLGLALALSGDRPGAMAAYRRALELNPGFAEADYNLANALSAEGRDTEALARYGEALRLNPGLAEAHNGLGLALAKAGRDREAATEYGRALAARPSYAEADYNFGNLMARSGRLAEAAAAYRAALSIRPDFFEAKANLANTLLGEGSLPEAIALYGEIIRLRPDYADAHYNLGLALRKMGRTQEAEAQFQAARLLGGR